MNQEFSQEFSQHAQEIMNLLSFHISIGKHSPSSSSFLFEDRRQRTVDLLTNARNKIIFISIFHPQDAIYLLRLVLTYISNVQLDKVKWDCLTYEHYVLTLEFCTRVEKIKTDITNYHVDCEGYVRQLAQKYAQESTPAKYLCNEDQINLKKAVSEFKTSICTNSLATKEELAIFSSALNQHLKMFGGTYLNFLNLNLSVEVEGERYLSLKSRGGCSKYPSISKFIRMFS